MDMTLKKNSPGSEWLYIKLYTGVKTADIILEEAVSPLLKKLQKRELIKKWFFIRYHDPAPHLRIRFELSDPDSFSKVLAIIKDYLKEHTESRELSNFVLDTYQREIKRYGEATIEDAEFLFWKNSNSVLYEHLHFNDEEKIIVSFFYIDKILDYIGLSILEKLDWIKEFNIAFKHEFKADKKLNSQLDRKYRSFVPKYFEFVNSKEYVPFKECIHISIHESEKILQSILKHYSGPLQNFFQSIFHMNINRMFVSNQRMFEMIIYDYLFRYYKSIAFKIDSQK
ncbi:thiopeptide-type bacteriocin biosynthesis protein [Chryseobacterium sp. W4I1]|uniref:thiopeptide-type bacteriocin biosynthesis protein n=1 Tax=Chryseobacterium sp. W4I1 TaxID=3042293 RepID=UPI00278AA714|nr:thiopeptide-type bacteriocin biosynthesis protein [Chryseobacterium sp. W4I1]MDQ0784490.1 thiopeptide-type bacteriocin biosynthesis protein [Chryseobacterium sp. W4I1]